MAATDNVVLNNDITYEGSGRSTLDALIVESINRDDIMPEHKNYASMLEFTDTTLVSPDQKFGSKSAPKPLRDVTETGVKERVDFLFGPKKGVYQKEIAGEFSMSYLFSRWAKEANTVEGAPGNIQAELADVASQSRDLVMAYDMRYATELVKVITKGFTVSAAEGPGSATPKGLSLFNASHTIAAGGTFSNLVTGAAYTDIATGTAKLQSAIDLLKKVKDENGKKIKQAKGEAYKLYVSRVKEVFWKQVLNDNSQFSGQGTNANQLNQFNFKGNLVEIVVLDLLGDTDENGAAIGTDEMFFVSNPYYVRTAKALRTYRLYSPVVKTFQNQVTDEFNTSIRAVVGVDHYGAEYGIVGSTGIA